VYVLNDQQKEQLNKKKIKEESSAGSFTAQDEENIKRWTEKSRIFDQSKVRTYEKSVIKELIRLVMFTNPLSERSKMRLKTELDSKARSFIEKMEQFVQLPFHDKELIKHLNIPVVTAMQACSFFSPELSWFEQLSAVLGVKDVEKLQRKLVEYTGTDLGNRKLVYTDLFDSPHPEDMHRFRQLQRQVSSWPQDCYEYVLMVLLLVFIPQEEMTDGGVYVGEMQSQFSDLLYRYLTNKFKKTPGVASLRFGKAIENISHCEELALIINKRINHMDVKPCMATMPMAMPTISYGQVHRFSQFS